MNSLKISVAQFEPKDGDKSVNLVVMEDLVRRAKQEGAEVISFHELCTTGYTFLKDLDENKIDQLAEAIYPVGEFPQGEPGGATIERLTALANVYDIVILAGVLEKECGKYYNTYVAVDKTGLVAKHRKLHPFISTYLSAGDSYTTFDIKGWKGGILICYDNNIIENVRATSLLGAEIIFAPHVTGCTPSSMPGRGYVDDKFWQNREIDPVSLRLEFDGPKGRRWLMRWLPARAYDNGVYYAFTNPIGYDGEHLKNGNSMIIDPYGEIMSEIRSFEDDISIATITKDKIPLAGGFRYKNARRPELYKEIIGQEHESSFKPVWIKDK